MLHPYQALDYLNNATSRGLVSPYIYVLHNLAGIDRVNPER